MKTSSIFLSAIGLAAISSAIPVDLLKPHTRDVVDPSILDAHAAPGPLRFHSKVPLKNAPQKDVGKAPSSPSINIDPQSNTEIGKGLPIQLHRGDIALSSQPITRLPGYNGNAVDLSKTTPQPTNKSPVFIDDKVEDVSKKERLYDGAELDEEDLSKREEENEEINELNDEFVSKSDHQVEEIKDNNSNNNKEANALSKHSNTPTLNPRISLKQKPGKLHSYNKNNNAKLLKSVKNGGAKLKHLGPRELYLSSSPEKLEQVRLQVEKVGKVKEIKKGVAETGAVLFALNVENGKEC